MPLAAWPWLPPLRDAAGNTATASQTLVVADPHDASAPDVELLTPADNAQVSSPTDVIGTVTDDNLVFYTLSVAPFGTSTSPSSLAAQRTVTNGVLGQFDPTMLSNDSYVLRLTAVDAGGHTSIDEHVVNVFSNLKLGNFTLSFDDLTMPVSGIPITRDADLRHADRQRVERLRLWLAAGVPRRGTADQRGKDRRRSGRLLQSVPQ